MSGLRLSDHAKRRRRERRITEHAIEAALSDPDISCADGSVLNCWRDGIKVVVDLHTGRVVTVSHRDEQGPWW